MSEASKTIYPYVRFSECSNDWLTLICLNEDPHKYQLFTELKSEENSYMVNHGLAAKLPATDLLLLRSLGMFFAYKKFISSLSARSFCNNVILIFFLRKSYLRVGF